MVGFTPQSLKFTVFLLSIHSLRIHVACCKNIGRPVSNQESASWPLTSLQLIFCPDMLQAHVCHSSDKYIVNMKESNGLCNGQISVTLFTVLCKSAVIEMSEIITFNRLHWPHSDRGHSVPPWYSVLQILGGRRVLWCVCVEHDLKLLLPARLYCCGATSKGLWHGISEAKQQLIISPKKVGNTSEVFMGLATYVAIANDLDTDICRQYV